MKEAVVSNMPFYNNMPEADERISIKKEQIFSYLVYSIVSLGRMARKAETFSWRSDEYKFVAKYL